jgi:hypothetical protein
MNEVGRSLFQVQYRDFTLTVTIIRIHRSMPGGLGWFVENGTSAVTSIDPHVQLVQGDLRCPRFEFISDLQFSPIHRAELSCCGGF